MAELVNECDNTERAGFEPAERVAPFTGLSNRRLQPGTRCTESIDTESCHLVLSHSHYEMTMDGLVESYRSINEAHPGADFTLIQIDKSLLSIEEDKMLEDNPERHLEEDEILGKRWTHAPTKTDRTTSSLIRYIRRNLVSDTLFAFPSGQFDEIDCTIEVDYEVFAIGDWCFITLEHLMVYMPSILGELANRRWGESVIHTQTSNSSMNPLLDKTYSMDNQHDLKLMWSLLENMPNCLRLDSEA